MATKRRRAPGQGAIQERDRAEEPAPRDLVDELREGGWRGSPLVVHGDEVLSSLDRYEAAVFLGMEDQVPRITLQDVFEEAGLDMSQIAADEGGGVPEEDFFEDYLRELPRHIRDKYEL